MKIQQVNAYKEKATKKSKEIKKLRFQLQQTEEELNFKLEQYSMARADREK